MSHGANGWDGGRAGGTIVSTPATSRDIALVRVLAAAFGSTCDMTLDAMEDLRLAVDEACGMLVESYVAADGDAGRLVVVFDADRARGEVVVDARRAGVRPAAIASDVATMVLDALTLEWSAGFADGEASVVLRVATGLGPAPVDVS